MDYEQTGISHRPQEVAGATVEARQKLHELTPDTRTSKAHTALQSGAAPVQQAESYAAAQPLIARPDVVYLQEPVVLFGITIRYSEDGCRYLIQHWQAILEKTDDKRTDKAHIRMLLENWKQYLELYERSREA